MTQYETPGFTSQVITITNYELLRFLRGKKIIGIIAITVIIASFFLALPELVDTGSPVSLTDFVTGPITMMFFLLVLIGALFGSNSIVSEYHEKTGYTLFTNPVKNTTIWCGKFLAAELIAFLVVFLYYLIIVGGALVRYSDVPTEIAASLGFSLVVATMLMSASFLISSVLRGPTGAAVLVFFIFIMLFPISDGLLTTFVQTKPWFSPNFSAGIVDKIITVPYPTDQSPQSVMGMPFSFTIYIPDVSHSLGVMFLYIVGCCVASILIFKYRQLG